jgi:hypothetical protein
MVVPRAEERVVQLPGEEVVRLVRKMLKPERGELSRKERHSDGRENLGG